MTAGALVVVPTYNEADNLEELAARLRRAVPDAELLVVDDGSPDGTADLARTLGRRMGGVHVLARSGKQGLGAAYRAGFAWALERGHRRVVQMDADLSHDPADVPRLLARLADADLAIGSRYVRGGAIDGWPAGRWLLSRAANLYAQLMLAAPVRDLTGGFKAWRAATLERIGVAGLRSNGYVFQVETTLRAMQAGLRPAEIPILFRERIRGVSKMGLHVAAEGLGQVIRLAWESAVGAAPAVAGGQPPVLRVTTSEHCSSEGRRPAVAPRPVRPIGEPL
jgi:dolichol-phosphate mannosyltransferase